MTFSEALRVLLHNYEKFLFDLCEDGTYDIISSAVQRQVPVKPVGEEQNHSTNDCWHSVPIPRCGKCGCVMDVWQCDLNFCPECGQAIDWSDEEKEGKK